ISNRLLKTSADSGPTLLVGTVPEENSLAMRSRFETVDVSADDRRLLERWLRSGTTPQRFVLRSRIVLLIAKGLSGREVARRLGVSRHTVDLWRNRYRIGGCEALRRDKA